jgi:EAL domain-containing protein (putative c-di-GMP-specific phosphodiesterase class I)
MKTNIQIHNVETNEIIETILDDKESKLRADNLKLEIAETKAREAARQTILDRLGLTADEAKLLLG